ncbi:S8 family peptidase [Salinibacterium soli]|uniref:S8 family serine peptidase n=1 Tax=Antiquaquibacter soli TaxID=3064523 RepID=A0ABT9BQI9_9MICO|nr:S8 family serine peptidase [Protaetiibacter sp. WY-16]MDO7883288.1 S8 family serine peptidase [Protaetiibacter sp. WY-16]
MTRRVAAAVVLGLVASVALGAAPASADAVRDGEYWLDEYGIRAAWATTQGAGITIAVIDTGVDGSVPELRGAVTGGADFSGLGSSNGQTPVGSTGSDHGTMVASLAAGRGTGGDNGVIGSAPAANILSVSIGFGEGTMSSDDQIAAAVKWSVDNGADIINMSLTRNTIDWPESWDDAFLYAAEHDVVVVAAAGNRGSGTTQVGAPATMPGVLTVAGVDAAGEASFDASSQGITIAVAAPSENLVGVVPGGGHVRWNGTSGAAPIVSGIVALVMAAHPGLDAANVINRVVSTARDAGAAGADPIYGFGLVDAAAAVTASVPTVGANPMGELSEWITLYRRADSTPAPLPSGVPYTVPEPIALAPSSPLGTLLPTVNELRVAGIPLLVFAVFLAIAGAAVALGIRRTKRARKSE